MEAELEKTKEIIVRRIWGEEKQGFRAGETYFTRGKNKAFIVIAFPENLVPEGCVPMVLSPDELFEEDECCSVHFIPKDQILGGPHKRNHINGDGA
jgi:hypothetical protein